MGNRVGVEELDGSFACAYDPSGQLLAEHRTGTGAHSCTFSYDGLGNRLNRMTADGSLTSYTYNPASELLGTDLGGALTTFGYDAAGNSVREVGPSVDVSYTWDAENRMVEVEDGESAATYAYDATGLRRKKVAGGSTTNFVWDRVNVLAELDGSRRGRCAAQLVDRAPAAAQRFVPPA